MAERYFGNSLSDLQAALTARDRMLAEQNIASQGNTVKFTQGLQQLAAQRAAQQQAADQAAMQNAIAQQQLQSSDYFNRGRLANESDRIKTEMELAKQNALAQASNADAERKNRLAIANIGAGQRVAPEIAAQNEMVDAANNFASLLNAKEELQSQIDQLAAAKKASENLSPFKTFAAKSLGVSPVYGAYDYFKNNQSRKDAAFSQLPYQTPADPNLDMASNLSAAEASIAAKASELDRLIQPGVQLGLGQHVTKQNGKWVSTLKPVTPQSFFNSPPQVPTAVPSFGQFQEGQIIYRQGVPFRVVNGQPVPVQ